MNIKRFLERIGYKGKVSISYECLSQLQETFIGSVPFENIDIINKVALDFSTSAVYEKIVERKRGGVCFENNSLFFWALSEIGFDVRIIEAEMFPKAQFKGHFDHMALIVTMDEVEYLVDVGNGKYFGQPMSILSSAVTVGEGTNYKISKYADDDFVLCFEDNDGWKFRYAFRLASKSLTDFKKVSTFIETSPDSPFTQALLSTVYNGSKRVTLSGNRLVITEKSGIQKEKQVPESEVKETLFTQFGLSL
ncbi:arylamine N-acetyltransferase family protein [Vibrio hippocampi]|uniref:Arylamine N-acetyltransferase n=1 Tax=Vibrio hippocampi TaxID=654686 RepID=A0ABM8ZNX4_9VIBR|nr:arylamine N-acetyltransferase [Vibrio hippocampi]CAH0530275.1 Arylamine N-acetyltransferase [Vibrio hippocampi]